MHCHFCCLPHTLMHFQLWQMSHIFYLREDEPTGWWHFWKKEKKYCVSPLWTPLVETGRRLGSTERHMSHQRWHHIYLDMGRMITCYTCIALMAEPWCDLPVDRSRLDQIIPECSRPSMRSLMMSPSQVLLSRSFMYIYLRIPPWMISCFSSLFHHQHQQVSLSSLTLR